MTLTIRSVFGLFLAAILGAGCVSVEQEHRIYTSTTAPTAVRQKTWKKIDQGIERYETAYGSSTSKGELIMYRFTGDGFDWSFLHTTSAQSVRDWADDVDDELLVVNGVYFHEDYSPSGLLITEGERVGPREFDFDKSGLIVLTPEVHIIDTKTDTIDLSSVDDAAQTYPFLIEDGNLAVREDSGLTAPRSFIGTDKEGRTYIGVAVSEPVSLYTMMKILEEQGVAWNMVLNLDGGPSTGLVTSVKDAEETINSFVPVPNVIIVKRKK